MEHKNRQKHLVIFQPSGRRGYIYEGETIMEASQELDADFERQFVQAMYFPHVEDVFPHLKQL